MWLSTQEPGEEALLLKQQQLANDTVVRGSNLVSYTNTHSSAHTGCRKILIACINIVLFFFYPRYLKWCSVFFFFLQLMLPKQDQTDTCGLFSAAASAKHCVHFKTKHRSNTACLSLMTYALFVYSVTGSHDVSARWLSVQATQQENKQLSSPFTDYCRESYGFDFSWTPTVLNMSQQIDESSRHDLILRYYSLKNFCLHKMVNGVALT